MKLFTVGPVQMSPQTLAVAGQQVPYFRNAEFSAVVLECERLLLQLAGAGAGSRALLLAASGTGAMEATVLNCLNSADKALIIDGGTFGRRFVQICQRLSIPHEVLTLAFGETLTAEHLAAYAGRGCSALLANLDETSTGQLYDLELLAGFCRQNAMLLIVDAISAFLADPIDMASAGIGAMIISSQKGLALSPGLSAVLLSEQMLSERVLAASVPSLYFDFKPALSDGLRGQTPFTPPVGIIYELADQLTTVCDIGLEAWLAQIRELAEDFRVGVAPVPGLELPGWPLSNALTPIIFSAGGAQEANRRLQQEFGLVLNPCGGQQADTMLRVGHIGYHNKADNAELLSALSSILISNVSL
ncbi:MAG: aminotransferase class V-fold PLP-dependent enzyme [Coriobacteriales bacterium]|nr:aminotransferase class V-fold PLP-dependent enzyme [Coriobacteriales bacterium]